MHLKTREVGKTALNIPVLVVEDWTGNESHPRVVWMMDHVGTSTSCSETHQAQHMISHILQRGCRENKHNTAEFKCGNKTEPSTILQVLVVHTHGPLH